MSSKLEFLQLALAILEYILLGRVVTIAQLQLSLENRFNVYGSAGLAARANPMIRFWAGMSEPFMQAIEWLLAEGAIRMEFISPVLYYCDRFFLDIPPVDPRHVRFLLGDWDKYAWIIKEPTWFPMTLVPGAITFRELLDEPITPSLLRTVLDMSDEGITKREHNEQFGQLVVEAAGELSLMNEAGIKGECDE